MIHKELEVNKNIATINETNENNNNQTDDLEPIMVDEGTKATEEAVAAMDYKYGPRTAQHNL